MSLFGVFYMINGMPVTCPDDEQWEPVSMGDALTALQKRSPWYRLTWSKNVIDGSRVDWFEFDNTELTSLVTRIPDSLWESAEYTDAVCQSVTMRHNRHRGVDYTAVFLVKVN